MPTPRPGCGPYIKWISDALAAEANRHLKQHNLTLSQSHVLMALYRQEEHCASLKELESLFDVSQPTMAGLASRLEAKGLVESFCNPQDRRSKRLRLTMEGVRLCQASQQEITETEARLTASLTAQERELFYSMLQRIYQSLR